jgi:hypothetical protein
MRDRETAPWLELAERAEKAAGPDRRLDYDVFVANAEPEVFSHWDPRDDRHRYTSSVDAVLCLIEEALAGWGFGSLVRAYAVGDDPSPFYGVLVASGYGGVPGRWNNRVEAVGATKALALLAAFCRARSTLSSALAKEEGS